MTKFKQSEKKDFKEKKKILMAIYFYFFFYQCLRTDFSCLLQVDKM